MFLSNDSSLISRQGNRLVQKYIENVLILQEFKNRKLDLRVWVLVTPPAAVSNMSYFFHPRETFLLYCLDIFCDAVKLHKTDFS